MNEWKEIEKKPIQEKLVKQVKCGASVDEVIECLTNLKKEYGDIKLSTGGVGKNTLFLDVTHLGDAGYFVII